MANTSVGAVQVDLELNNKSFNSDLKSTIKSTEKTIDKSVESTTKNTESAFSSCMKSVGKLIASAFAVSTVVNFTKECINSASEIQSAWTGLNSIISGTGNSFSEAQDFITEYTSDGLVTVSEAVTAYKNLLSRGYDTSQIEGTLERLKDAAAFGRQSSYDLGEAVVTATEGLKNENSILVDNAGVTKNVAKMWEEYAAKIGTTSANLTTAQKIQAEYEGIMEETKYQVGDAATYTQTYAGQVQKLKASFTNLKTAIGKVVTPIVQLFIPAINSAVQAVTSLFEALQNVLACFGLEMSDVVSSTSSSVSDLSSELEDTASTAVSSAKTINRAFAGVDEINVLSTTTSSSDSDSSDDSGSSSAVSSVTTATEAASSSMDKLKAKLTELFDTFKDGFNISIGSVNFDGILQSISNIKSSLNDIFTDETVVSSADTMVTRVINSLGRITGGITRIGINITDGLVGSISTYLQTYTPRIKDFFVSMFDITGNMAEIRANFVQALGEISDVFSGDTVKSIGSDILAIFINPLMRATEVLSKFATDLTTIFVQPIVDNVEMVKQTFQNVLEPIETVISTIAEAFTYVGDKWTEIYDEHIAPLMESLKDGLSDTFGKFLEVYNEYFVPFLDNIASGISELWEQNIKPVIDKAGDLIGSIIDLIKVLWENWLKPIIDWIIENIYPVITPILNGIWNTVKTVFGSIMDIIGGVIDILKGIIDFITGIFSGDWSKAWNGIKEVFSGVFETAWAVIKGIFNTIIAGAESLVNTVISGLNNLLKPLTKVGNTILKAIGIDTFSFSEISKVSLPRLAQGGYIKANNPQLAIVGDNTSEGEIVTPESKIYDQVVKAIENTKFSDGKELKLILEVRYEDGKKIIKKINQEQIDAGEILLLV